MLSILPSINDNVTNIIKGRIENPILKRVIYEEIIFSDNLRDIFKEFFSSLVLIEIDQIDNYLIHFITLLDNIKDNIKVLVHKEIIQAFINLNSDEQIFLILNLTDLSKKIFVILSEDKTISQILKHLLSSLSISSMDEGYIIKFINSCKIINPIISNEIISDLILNHNIELINNDKILSVVFNYYCNDHNSLNHECYQKIKEIFYIKFDTFNIKLNQLKLDTMDMAFEIYKMGVFINDTGVGYSHFSSLSKIELDKNKLEYIVKSIHTSLIHDNIQQAKKILSIIFVLDVKNIKTFINYYNDWLLIRIKTKTNIIDDEKILWNINNDYNSIMKMNIFSEYQKIINNLTYSKIINNDLQKVFFVIGDTDKVKKLDNVNIKLILNSISDNVKHHPKIDAYINDISRYIDKCTQLQKIEHDSRQSKITITTKYGNIKCPLLMGSILLYLNDGDKTLQQLENLLKLSDDEIQKRMKILMFYNIVVCINETEYKYVEPYGSIDCEDSLPITKNTDNDEYIKFTDIIMTIESRIMKYVKPEKINKMELERKIQEFLGTSFCRNIYYNQLESLKKRYYIEEIDDMIQYIV